MAYNLTNEEQETIIIFSEAESTAHITTFNGALIRKLTALCAARPDEATSKGPDQNGEYVFTVMKKWVKVNAGPTYTDEQINACKERASALHSKK